MYQCRKCGRTGERGQLVIHVIKSHVPTTRAPWFCDLCGFRSTKRSDLVKHVDGYYPHLQAKARGNTGHDSNHFRQANLPYIVREDIDIIYVPDRRRKAETSAEDGERQKRRKVDERRVVEKTAEKKTTEEETTGERTEEETTEEETTEEETAEKDTAQEKTEEEEEEEETAEKDTAQEKTEEEEEEETLEEIFLHPGVDEELGSSTTMSTLINTFASACGKLTSAINQLDGRLKQQEAATINLTKWIQHQAALTKQQRTTTQPTPLEMTTRHLRQLMEQSTGKVGKAMEEAVRGPLAAYRQKLTARRAKETTDALDEMGITLPLDLDENKEN